MGDHSNQLITKSWIQKFLIFVNWIKNFQTIPRTQCRIFIYFLKNSGSIFITDIIII